MYGPHLKKKVEVGPQFGRGREPYKTDRSVEEILNFFSFFFFMIPPFKTM